MNKSSGNFSHAATIFPVEDISRSLEFYTEKLGFENTFDWGDPVTYAVLKKDGVSIHITLKVDNHVPSKEHCALYVFVHNVEEIYRQCMKNKVPILGKPEVRDFKMKDFDIIDPDGYILSFGKGE